MRTQTSLLLMLVTAATVTSATTDASAAISPKQEDATVMAALRTLVRDRTEYLGMKSQQLATPSKPLSQTAQFFNFPNFPNYFHNCYQGYFRNC